MMVQDSSPPPRRPLSDETLAVVREALVAHARAPESGDDVHAALARLGDEARANGVLPEEMLVALKRIWADVAAHDVGTLPSDQHRLLQQLVTLSIKSYYR